MTVGEEADDDQKEDDEEPEDDLHLPVPQCGGAAQLPGLTAAVGADWGPAVTNPLPLHLRARRHSVPNKGDGTVVQYQWSSGVVKWCGL